MLTSQQFDEIVSAYAERVVEGMDLKTLEQFAYDCIVENLSVQDDESLVLEISNYYEEDELKDLLESVGANPADYDINTDGDVLTEEQQEWLRENVGKNKE